jgi:hypothetical protein
LDISGPVDSIINNVAPPVDFNGQPLRPFLGTERLASQLHPSQYCTLSDNVRARMVEPPLGVEQWIIMTAWHRLSAQLPASRESYGTMAQFSVEARTEAAWRLIRNHEAVFRDVVNPSPNTSVIGTLLTQPELQRVPVNEDPRNAQHVDAMLREVTRRILGRVTNPLPPVPMPTREDHLAIWRMAVAFLYSVRKRRSNAGTCARGRCSAHVPCSILRRAARALARRLAAAAAFARGPRTRHGHGGGDRAARLPARDRRGAFCSDRTGTDASRPWGLWHCARPDGVVRCSRRQLRAAGYAACTGAESHPHELFGMA